MVEKSFNTIGHICYVNRSHNPPHCIGYQDLQIVEGFSIPCGRGNAPLDNNILIRLFFTVVINYTAPVIIITTMVMMYRTVLKIERNAARYGVSTLRLNVQLERERVENDSNDDTTEKIQGSVSHWSYSLTISSDLLSVQQAQCWSL